jgi:hypothetical protein
MSAAGVDRNEPDATQPGQWVWRLTPLQCVALIGVALSPTLGEEALGALWGPGPHTVWALLPAFPFLPLGWIGGMLAVSLMAPVLPLLPQGVVYACGFSLTVFLTAWLCLAQWRGHRRKRSVTNKP